MARSRLPRVLGVAFVVLALALSAACTRGANAAWRGDSGTGSPAPGGTAGAPAGPGVLPITPATGTAAAPVREAVTVSADGATLESVAVTTGGGKPVDGSFDAERRTWRSTESLAYGKTYTATATATTAKGGKITQTSQF